MFVRGGASGVKEKEWFGGGRERRNITGRRRSRKRSSKWCSKKRESGREEGLIGGECGAVEEGGGGFHFISLQQKEADPGDVTNCEHIKLVLCIVYFLAYEGGIIEFSSFLRISLLFPLRVIVIYTVYCFRPFSINSSKAINYHFVFGLRLNL